MFLGDSQGASARLSYQASCIISRPIVEGERDCRVGSAVELPKSVQRDRSHLGRPELSIGIACRQTPFLTAAERSRELEVVLAAVESCCKLSNWRLVCSGGLCAFR